MKFILENTSNCDVDIMRPVYCDVVKMMPGSVVEVIGRKSDFDYYKHFGVFGIKVSIKEKELCNKVSVPRVEEPKEEEVKPVVKKRNKGGRKPVTI